MKHEKVLNEKLEKQLERLKVVPGRDVNAALKGRTRFLAEAASLRPRPAAHKNRVDSRRLVWRFALATLVVVVFIFAGGVGVVSAASNTLPGQTLYPVKLLTEDVRLDLTQDPQAAVDLLMKFLTERVSEMNQLTERNGAIPEGTTERCENHIQLAMELAAGMDDEEMQAALYRIRASLEEQNQLLAQPGGGAGDSLGRVHSMFRARLQMVDEGLSNQETFRNRVRHGWEENTQDSVPGYTSTPGSGSEPDAGSTPTGKETPPEQQCTPEQTPGQQCTPQQTPGRHGQSGPPN